MQPRFRTTHKKLANGQRKVYYYLLSGQRFFESYGQQIVPPYPADFLEAHKAATAHEKPARGDLDRMCQAYLDSPEFASLSDASKKGYRPVVDRIRARFGDASIAVIEDRRFRGKLLAWRDEMKGSARYADMHMIILSSILKHAIAAGKLDRNPAKAIPKLYSAPLDKRPWSEQEIAAFLNECPQHLQDALRLKFYTGLRRADLIRIGWKADQGDYLLLTTSKRKAEAVIPIVPEARAFLDDLKRRQMASPRGLQPTMLLTSYGTPWTPDGYSSSFDQQRSGHRLRDVDGKKKLVLVEELKVTINEHRLRSNTATFWMKCGLDDRTIADAMGWSSSEIASLRRVYVDRKQAVVAALNLVKRASDQTGT